MTVKPEARLGPAPCRIATRDFDQNVSSPKSLTRYAIDIFIRQPFQTSFDEYSVVDISVVSIIPPSRRLSNKARVVTRLPPAVHEHPTLILEGPKRFHDGCFGVAVAYR